MSPKLDPLPIEMAGRPVRSAVSTVVNAVCGTVAGLIWAFTCLNVAFEPEAGQVISAVTATVIGATALAKWFMMRPLRGPVVLLVAILCAGVASSLTIPTLTELDAEGVTIVTRLEAYRSTSGRYPPSLEAAGITDITSRYDGWEYVPSPDGQSFDLSIGDYGKHLFMFSYSPKHGWYHAT